jgi:Mg2+/Co2+ transporter CorB
MGTVQGVELRSLLHPVFYVPDASGRWSHCNNSSNILRLIALVLDEYGQVAGLVTVDDMLDELVCDIVEEGDTVDTAVVR